jgi:hypothetical protein
MSLWLGVLLQAIRDIKNREHTRTAWQWLTDRDNIVFDMLSEALGYEPEGLRQLIFSGIPADTSI